ncbi:MAG TPA: S4 domain-containing protein, partial [bacterium]|nr:S4 domain-containing protein [bacterium]
MSAPIRLNRFLSSAGIASRRRCDEYIREGRVAVNGNIVTELGTRVAPDLDQVTL